MDKNTKIALNIIGIMIFIGWFLVSFIEAANKTIKYSTYTVWEFRFFILACAVIYFTVVYFITRKSKEANNSSKRNAS